MNKIVLALAIACVLVAIVSADRQGSRGGDATKGESHGRKPEGKGDNEDGGSQSGNKRGNKNDNESKKGAGGRPEMAAAVLKQDQNDQPRNTGIVPPHLQQASIQGLKEKFQKQKPPQ